MEEIKNIVDTICNVRNGSMDEKQFRATVEHNIDLAVSKERERIAKAVEESDGFVCIDSYSQPENDELILVSEVLGIINTK